MCQCASVPMICALRRGGAKRLALTAEIKHESQNKNDQSKPRMTLKGSNLHTKNTTTINHNPVGVEFRKNNSKQITKPIRA